MNKPFLQTLALASLIGGVVTVYSSCGGRDSYQLAAPSVLGPGKSANVSVGGNVDGGTTFLWTATAGRFDGPVNGISATFVAPEKGSVTLVCTIVKSGGKAVVVEKQIAIGDSSLTGVGIPPVPAPPAGGKQAQPVDIESAGFVPAGFMGDIKALKVDPGSMVRPHSAPRCQRWSFSPSPGAADLWSAVAWQFPASNFGAKPGKDWSTRGFQQVSVWARADADRNGLFPKVQFKAGGNTDSKEKHQASFEVEGDFETLTDDWRQYTLNLRGQNLSQVIAAFVFVVRVQDVGPQGATFYLDDIEYR